MADHFPHWGKKKTQQKISKVWSIVQVTSTSRVLLISLSGWLPVTQLYFEIECIIVVDHPSALLGLKDLLSPSWECVSQKPSVAGHLWEMSWLEGIVLSHWSSIWSVSSWHLIMQTCVLTPVDTVTTDRHFIIGIQLSLLLNFFLSSFFCPSIAGILG